MTKEFFIMRVHTLGYGILLILFVLSSCGDAAPITGSADADLSAAEIHALYPLTVLPGTLVSVKGSGFGDFPGLIYLNGEGLDQFFGWDDSTIWFRVPGETDEYIEVQVGRSVADDRLSLAPDGSVTLCWTVDASAVQEFADDNYDDYGLDFAPEWQYPLYVKGQWIKSAGNFGMKSDSWDTGSRTIMWNKPDSNLWISETVFTPENQESFLPRMMLFAFEDGNNATRNLSTFESDIAYILKREWASKDPHANVLTDPGASVGDHSTLLQERRRGTGLSGQVGSQGRRSAASQIHGAKGSGSECSAPGAFPGSSVKLFEHRTNKSDGQSKGHHQIPGFQGQDEGEYCYEF